MIKHVFSRQFLLFIVAGASAALLHWISRIALSLYLPYSTAVVISYGVGMAVAFALNLWLVFPQSGGKLRIQARDFFIVNIIFFPIVWTASLTLSSIFAEAGLPHHQAIAHGIAVALPSVLTFLIYKLHIFKGNNNE